MNIKLYTIMKTIFILKRYCLLIMLLVAFIACDDDEPKPKTSKSDSPTPTAETPKPKELTQAEIAKALEGTTDFQYTLAFTAFTYKLKAEGSGTLVRKASGDSLNMEITLNDVDILQSLNSDFDSDTYTFDYNLVSLKVRKQSDNTYALTGANVVDEEGNVPTFSSQDINDALAKLSQESKDFELKSFKTTITSNGLKAQSTFVISKELAANILTTPPPADLTVQATLVLTYQKRT